MAHHLLPMTMIKNNTVLEIIIKYCSELAFEGEFCWPEFY